MPLRVDLEFDPFWEAAEAGRLVVQACEDCGRRRWPPRASCAVCGSMGTLWCEMHGDGRVYSWVVVHRATKPENRARTPYAVVVVALDQDPTIRLVGGIERATPERPLEIGVPVEVQFLASHDGRVRPSWRVK